MADINGPPDDQKVRKADVDYSLGGDHCGACQFWIENAEDEATETGQCQKVAGEIEEDFWCTLFKRQKSTIAQGAGAVGAD